MGRALKALSKGFAALALFTALLIVIFDVQSSPPSKPSSWHAYLTEDELQHPRAKFWFDRAEPDAGVLEALNA